MVDKIEYGAGGRPFVPGVPLNSVLVLESMVDPLWTGFSPPALSPLEWDNWPVVWRAGPGGPIVLGEDQELAVATSDPRVRIGVYATGREVWRIEAAYDDLPSRHEPLKVRIYRVARKVADAVAGATT